MKKLKYILPLLGLCLGTSQNFALGGGSNSLLDHALILKQQGENTINQCKQQFDLVRHHMFTHHPKINGGVPFTKDQYKEVLARLKNSKNILKNHALEVSKATQSFVDLNLNSPENSHPGRPYSGGEWGHANHMILHHDRLCSDQINNIKLDISAHVQHNLNLQMHKIRSQAALERSTGQKPNTH